MNVVEQLLAVGEAAAPAVIHRDVTLSYAELRRRVNAIATGLLQRGCQKGVRIGVWADNGPFFVCAYLGVMRAGLVAVPFATDLAAKRFAAIVGEAGLELILVQETGSARLRPWAAELGVALLREGELEQWTSAPGQQMPAIDGERDLAALMFTSGSTGTPKGVMVSHRNIISNTRDIVRYLGLTPADRVMVVLPFHYCFGASLLHSHLLAGGSVVLNNEFMYPESVLQELAQRNCTGFAGVPSTYQILLRKTRFCERDFPTLRWLQQAGGKLPNACIKSIRDAFPEVRFYLMYGQTEATARLSFLPPERLGDKLGSIGRGLPSTKVEVLNQAGIPVQPGSDEVGEIVASGDNITLGYWNDPVETNRFFRDGKLYTGDLARVDDEGFIFIVERQREMIKAGGNRVSAAEVEEVIAELPEVMEVAVVGVPHELLGEVVRAFIVCRPGATLTSAQVQSYCRRSLPTFKVPQTVDFLEEMPHNHAGKIIKSQLRAPVTGAVLPVES